MNEDFNYILTFLTTTGNKDTYIIPRANTELSKAEVVALMQRMIENETFATVKGKPFTSAGAQLEKISNTEYEIA